MQIERVTVKSENDTTRKVVLALTFELAFLAIFIVGCYVKCFKPEAYGTEKNVSERRETPERTCVRDNADVRY